MTSVATDSELVRIAPGAAAAVTTLLEAGADGRLGVARTAGPVLVTTADAIAWIVVEGGTGSLRVDDDDARPVAGRTDVFSGPGWSALLGPRSRCALTGDVRATVVWRAEARAVASRVIG